MGKLLVVSRTFSTFDIITYHRIIRRVGLRELLWKDSPDVLGREYVLVPAFLDVGEYHAGETGQEAVLAGSPQIPYLNLN